MSFGMTPQRYVWERLRGSVRASKVWVQGLTPTWYENRAQERYYAEKYRDVVDPYADYVLSLPAEGGSVCFDAQIETTYFLWGRLDVCPGGAASPPPSHIVPPPTNPGFVRLHQAATKDERNAVLWADILGIKVKKALREKVEAPRYTVTFDAKADRAARDAAIAARVPLEDGETVRERVIIPPQA